MTWTITLTRFVNGEQPCDEYLWIPRRCRSDARRSSSWTPQGSRIQQTGWEACQGHHWKNHRAGFCESDRYRCKLQRSPFHSSATRIWLLFKSDSRAPGPPLQCRVSLHPCRIQALPPQQQGSPLYYREEARTIQQSLPWIGKDSPRQLTQTWTSCERTPSNAEAILYLTHAHH